MSGLLDSCRNHFDTDNLYSVLGIKKTATESEGHGRGAKRGRDAANSYHLEQLKMLLKGDQITFIDGETEKEGVVVRIDRFNRLLHIEEGQQILRIPVHHLKKAEVKKGYHKVSLKVHPDRVPEEGKEEATLKFQTLGKVYCILSNKEKRAVYDETGEVDDEDDAIPQDRDWTAYWRLLFRKVTTEDLKDFEKNYKGSKEELEDLKTAYIEFKGDMTEILNNVMCSTIEDEPRFAKIIKGWIKKETVPDFPAFTKENKKSKEKRKREAEKEAAEAEELKQELGLKVDDSLKAMIQKRQQSRESQMGAFFDQLEAKYAQPKKARTTSSANKETKSRKKSKK